METTKKFFRVITRDEKMIWLEADLVKVEANNLQLWRDGNMVSTWAQGQWNTCHEITGAPGQALQNYHPVAFKGSKTLKTVKDKMAMQIS